MNREEFLKQLEELLSDISAEERADALDFYRSYFEDAGEGNEASILQELESPEKVAEVIKRDLGFVAVQGNADSENTKQSAGGPNGDAAGANQNNGGNAYWNQNANRDAEYYHNVNETLNNLKKENKKSNTGAIVVGILVAIITSPIWLSILAVIVTALFSVVIFILSIAFSVAAIMIALVFSGFGIIGVGITCLVTGSPIIGLALVGGGLIVLALGLLAIILMVWVCGAFLPWAFKGIIHLCKMPFEKRKERAAA